MKNGTNPPAPVTSPLATPVAPLANEEATSPILTRYELKDEAT